MKRIIDQFTDLPISGFKKWKLRNPEKYLKSERDRRARYRDNNPSGTILKRVRQRAKAKGLEFTLTKEDIIIPEFCPVLGLLLVRGSKKGTEPNAPSVDRIDNRKGYTPDNIKIISWRANTLKRDASVEELEMVINYMKENKSCAE